MSTGLDYCQAVLGSCDAVEIPDWEIWNKLNGFGAPAILLTAASLGVAYSSGSIERRLSDLNMPFYVVPSLMAIFLISIGIDALAISSVVLHNLNCCTAFLNDHQTSWTVANVFYILTLIAFFCFRVAGIKSGNSWATWLSGAFLSAFITVYLVCVFIIKITKVWATGLGFGIAILIIFGTSAYIWYYNKKKASGDYKKGGGSTEDESSSEDKTSRGNGKRKKGGRSKLNGDDDEFDDV